VKLLQVCPTNPVIFFPQLVDLAQGPLRLSPALSVASLTQG
jgi:hypothetical protein